MIEIFIPGWKTLRLEHLVMDYNGTLSCDGILLDGLKEKLIILSDMITLHVLTADTFGKAKRELAGIPVTLSILPEKEQVKGKLEYIMKLGASSCVCIGNGRNDSLMLKGAELGIVLIQEEGACVETLLSADVVCRDIFSALNLLTNTKRLAATLRV